MSDIRLYVLDTSYLLEFFEVNADSTPDGVQEIKKRFSDCVNNNHRMFVPLPVLFELANHIADVKNGESRNKLANKLKVAISSSLSDAIPWTITLLGEPKLIEELTKSLDTMTNRFADEFVTQKLGLTDTVIIAEAERLKEKNVSSSLKKYCVHIWTRHKTLKAYEPDPEPNPFS